VPGCKRISNFSTGIHKVPSIKFQGNSLIQVDKLKDRGSDIIRATGPFRDYANALKNAGLRRCPERYSNPRTHSLNCQRSGWSQKYSAFRKIPWELCKLPKHKAFGRTAPRIPNLGSIQIWVVKFTPPSGENVLPSPQDMRIGWRLQLVGHCPKQTSNDDNLHVQTVVRNYTDSSISITSSSRKRSTEHIYMNNLYTVIYK
jgi:hypothetical protein